MCWLLTFNFLKCFTVRLSGCKMSIPWQGRSAPGRTANLLSYFYRKKKKMASAKELGAVGSISPKAPNLLIIISFGDSEVGTFS